LLVLAAVVQGCRHDHPLNPIDEELNALLDEPVEVSANTPFVSQFCPHMTRLVAAGQQDVFYMIDRLQDDNLRVRMYCAHALGEIGDPSAADDLISLAEEMRRSPRRREYWHSGVEGETLRALAKIRDPNISAYALQRFQCVLCAAERGDFFIWGHTYTNLLKAQGCEDDIRRAVEFLKDAQRTK